MYQTTELYNSNVPGPGSIEPQTVKRSGSFFICVCVVFGWTVLFLRKAPGWNQGQNSFEHGAASLHPHTCAILKTLSHTFCPHSLRLEMTMKISKTKHTERSVHCVMTSGMFPPPLVPKLLFPKAALQLVSIITSKRLASIPGGNAPVFCHVDFPLRVPAF